MKAYRSIFNHALAPITPGPSSSNTCGPTRIGYECMQILGEVPASATVEYYSGGAFPQTLYGMKSDIAFINGLLGKNQNDPDFTDAYANAHKAGLEISFAEVDDLLVGGMETARIRMTAHNGRELTVIGESVGGGSFVIHYIDDIAMEDMRGLDYELLIFEKSPEREKALETAEKLRSMAEGINDISVVSGRSYAIIDAKLGERPSKELIMAYESDPDTSCVRLIEPVGPIVNDLSKKPVFDTPDEMIEYCRKHNCSPARAAIDYEKSISGWSDEEVRAYGDKLIGIMRASRDGGLRKDLSFDGIVKPKASLLNGRLGKGVMPSLGFLGKAIPYALGIMEHSNAAGQIVCVPTGGSSGIVPGLLLAAAEEMGIDDDQLYEGLMASGLIGILMMVDGNEFAGGTHGCQAEVACGTAMAAAGLVQIMGGNAREACDAAAMSLQCLLGLICDPVAGLVQVPCLARNMAGASIAATCAEAVCAGFDVVIPLDEMTRIMVRVGKEISDSLGLCCHGCCLTPTGERLKKEHDDAIAAMQN